jgi:hypothetical protein
MNEFEKKLFEMKVPRIEDDPFEDELRQTLLNTCYNPRRGYMWQFKLAAGIACVFAVFLFSIIMKPDLAIELNRIAFQTEEMKDVGAPYSLADPNTLPQELTYTSIYNPRLTEKINPENYREDSAYIIRKYTSPKEGSIMIVSEFNQQSNAISKRALPNGSI